MAEDAKITVQSISIVTACRSAPLALLLLTVAYADAQQLPKVRKQKQDKEPPTQTLPLQKEPPAAVTAETARLTFHVSPLSNKGLLSQQTRDGLKALIEANHGAPIVKLRAFVAGTGDLRRVQTIVSEMFTDKKMPLPALTTIQVGGLPMEGAQVVIESISADKKVVNPNGLAFFPAQRGADAAAALAQIQSAAAAAHVTAADMLHIACFLNSLEDVQAAQMAVTGVYPGAAADFVENRRLSTERGAQCEAVGRRGVAGKALEITPGAVLVKTTKLVLSGAQMAFREQDSDLRLAFDRLDKSLQPLGVGSPDVVYSRFYPLTRTVEEKLRATQKQVFPQAADSMLRIEGLPSVDASMAVEVIAVGK
jgi:enamine deaminase RidA (YjgF/YER057c/UK114 family)